MPDPQLYLRAMAASAAVSLVFILVLAAGRRPTTPTRVISTSVLATGLGVAVGYWILLGRLPWPPANALDRFLTIVIPVTLGIELIAGFHDVPGRIAWLMRLGLAALVPRILLHGSTYLSRASSGWSIGQVSIVLVVSGVLLAGVWALLSLSARRGARISIPLSISMSITCVGMTVMMAGYIKGGAAAFPFAATLAATGIAIWSISKRGVIQFSDAAKPIIGVGVIGLFSLLFIGTFFGRLSTLSALAMLFAPTICWLPQLTWVRTRKPWIVESLRLAAVALPLIVVLVFAKRDFDRKMGPLLKTVQAAAFCSAPPPRC